MEPAKSTKLTVQFPRDASRWNPDNVELPVEVRRSDSALVGRTLASGSLNVGPGTYVARAVAPGGEFAGSVEVPPGSTEARLHLRFYGQSNSRHAGSSHATLEHAPPEQATAKTSHRISTFELLEGHVLEGHPLPHAVTIQPDGNGMMRVPSSSGPMMLRVKASHGVSTLVSPIPQSIAGYLSCADASSEKRLDVDFHFDHPQAQLLLSYLRSNAIADAEVAAQSATLTAAQLLRGKKWDPLAGALGAYVLLRQSDDQADLTAELNDRSEQLWKYNPMFPDAWCIRAECRARAGENGLALETLLELDHRGLPFFSEGLRIAGLRLIDCLRPEVLPDLDESARRQASVLLRRLRWLGLHALPAEPILKLANFDPGDAEQYQAFWRSTES